MRSIVPSQQQQQQHATIPSSSSSSGIRQRPLLEFRCQPQQQQQRRRRRLLPIVPPTSWVSMLLLLLLLHGWNVIPQPSSAQSTVEVKLIPFQILYIANPDETSNAPVNEMQILAITRRHLIEYEFIHHSGFVTLALYQTVRMTSSSSTTTNTYPNGTMLIAYTGTATYNDDNQQHLIDQDMMYMCFLGTNGTTYITSLQQQAGWTTLQEIELMSMMGNNVYMNDNGTTTTNVNNNDKNPSQGGEETDSGEQTSSSSKMNNHMQTYIYLIAVCIPVGIILLCGICYLIYLFKYNVQWTWHDNSDDYDIHNIKKKKKNIHPMWVVHTNNGTSSTSSTTKRKSSNESKLLRHSRTLDFTNIHDPTNTTNIEDDCGSDELTLDNDDAVINVHPIAPSDTFIPVIVTLSSSSSTTTANEDIEHNGIEPIVVVKKSNKKLSLKQPTTSVLRVIGVEQDDVYSSNPDDVILIDHKKTMKQKKNRDHTTNRFIDSTMRTSNSNDDDSNDDDSRRIDSITTPKQTNYSTNQKHSRKKRSTSLQPQKHLVEV